MTFPRLLPDHVRRYSLSDSDGTNMFSILFRRLLLTPGCFSLSLSCLSATSSWWNKVYIYTIYIAIYLWLINILYMWPHCFLSCICMHLSRQVSISRQNKSHINSSSAAVKQKLLHDIGDVSLSRSLKNFSDLTWDLAFHNFPGCENPV